MKVSVIIPTFNRSDFLATCLRSCVAQTLRPAEILIGDDSRDDRTAALIHEFGQRNPSIPIRYFHHTPALGQDGNVSFLMQAATGSHLLLIHDDDWLMPVAVEALSRAFAQPGVVISFGRQLLASNDGLLLDAPRSEAFNRSFWRGPGLAGRQDDLLESALCGQFPNNGWLADRTAALRVDYRDPERQFGTGSDFRFSALFAEANRQGTAYLVDRDTTVYRLSADSIARSGRSTAAMHCFAYVLHCSPAITKPRVASWLRSKSRVAIAQATTHGRLDDAWQWYWGPWHRRYLLTPGGIRRGLNLARALGKNALVRLPALVRQLLHLPGSSSAFADHRPARTSQRQSFL